MACALTLQLGDYAACGSAEAIAEPRLELGRIVAEVRATDRAWNVDCVSHNAAKLQPVLGRNHVNGCICSPEDKRRRGNNGHLRRPCFCHGFYPALALTCFGRGYKYFLPSTEDLGGFHPEMNGAGSRNN